MSPKEKRATRKWIFRSVVPGPIRLQGLAAALFLSLAFSSLSGCTYLFFKPGKEFVQDAATKQHAPEDVYFPSADGVRLHGWFFKARSAARGTVLVCHGNVENVSTHARLDLWMIDAGYDLFIFDYRGYGRSQGTPGVEGINLDAEAALQTLLGRIPSGEKVIVFGKSLGGAVAVYTVANSFHKDRVKAVVLDSAFSSYRRIAREKIAASIVGWPLQYPLSLLVNNRFSPEDTISRIAPVPLLIMHGSEDEIVPEHHSRILYEAALQPKELWELNVRGHVKAGTDEATRSRLLAYLESLPGRRQPSP